MNHLVARLCCVAILALGCGAIGCDADGAPLFQRCDRAEYPLALRQFDEAGSDAEDGGGRGPESAEHGVLHDGGNTTTLATTIFDGGTTHFLAAGAVKMAELIVGEIRRNGGPLAAYLR